MQVMSGEKGSILINLTFMTCFKYGGEYPVFKTASVVGPHLPTSKVAVGLPPSGRLLSAHP